MTKTKRYTAKIYEQIPKNAKVVMPISMGQPLQQGEKLQAILASFESYDLTCLLCDYLNRHNVGETAALEQGDSFIEKYQTILSQYKLIRWKETICDTPQFTSFYNQIMKDSGKKH